MKSVWKGHIRFSLVTIPVQIFNAIEASNDIRFNQLHKEDHSRVRYKKTCATCDGVLSSKDIVKGYEYEPDKYVIIEKDDFAKIKLKSNRAIDIEAFVDLDSVPPSRFESVYYVGPHGEVAQKTFSLLVKTLQKSGKAGVGRIILRDREDVVLITADQDALIMYKLRYPYEVRDIAKVPDIEIEEVDESQLKLAETLVDSLTKDFSEINFEDRYRDALLEVIQEKIDGKETVHIADVEDEKPVVDIMDALKQSIEAAKKMKKGA